MATRALRADSIDWEMADMSSEPGALGGLYALPPLYVPARVELDSAQTRLVWTELWDWERGRDDAIRRAPHNLLTMFMRLAEAKPERIRDFARQWGILDICERHHIPASHESTHPLDGDEARCRAPSLGPAERESALPGVGDPDMTVGRSTRTWKWETIETWRTYARQARAMKNIAARLRGGNRGRQQDWRNLGYQMPESDWPYNVEEPRVYSKKELVEHEKERLSQDLIMQTMVLSSKVTEWLSWGGVQPQLTWGYRDVPRLRFAPTHEHILFGTLALRLALDIRGDTDILVPCSACGKDYIPTRKPALGRDNFCPKTECQQERARRATRRKRAGIAKPHRKTQSDLDNMR